MEKVKSEKRMQEKTMKSVHQKNLPHDNVGPTKIKFKAWEDYRKCAPERINSMIMLVTPKLNKSPYDTKKNLPHDNGDHKKR